MSQAHQHHSSSANMQLWYCNGCRQIHLRATNIALDFTREEFVSLGRAVFDILGREFTPDEIADLPLITPVSGTQSDRTAEIWPEELSFND
jgi:hypothetical protein